MTLQSNLSDCRNIGASSARMLAEAGIRSLDELRDLGPVVSFLAVRQVGQRPSLNLLWAIYGAVNDVAWNAIPEAAKQSLLEELHNLTK